MLWIIVVLLLFIVQFITILLADYRHPSKTVAWLVILLIFPLIGFVMYYFMAQTYRQKRKSMRKEQKLMKAVRDDLVEKAHSFDKAVKPLKVGTIPERLVKLLHSLPGCAICNSNKVTVYAETRATFKAMMAAIKVAENHIHFQFYEKAFMYACYMTE
jgi:cardiolipin synthase